MNDQKTPAIGWCATPDKAADLHAAGLDYLELQLVPLKLEDAESFAQAKSQVQDLPLPVPVMSYLFPQDMRLVGPEVHEDRAKRYMDKVVDLMAAAQTSLVVYGSGWTRNIPPDFDAARGQEQFLHAVQWCAAALDGIGATLVIEPLNRKESNQCNRVQEGVALAKLAQGTGFPNVRSLADFYHVDEEAESLAAVGALGGELAHVHLADTGRLNPGTGQYDYPTFFGALKRAGYRGRLSGECRLAGEDPVAAMRHSADFVRQAWRDA